MIVSGETPVEICLYLPVHKRSAADFEKAIREVTSEEDLLVLRTLSELSEKACGILTKRQVLILHPPDTPGLEALLKIERSLSSQKIILIVPDDRPETISAGHRLHPRLLVVDGSDAIRIVPAVLRKMLRGRGDGEWKERGTMHAEQDGNKGAGGNKSTCGT